MADIISLDNKRHAAQVQGEAILAERKRLAAHTLLKFTPRAARCERCGDPASTPPQAESGRPAPWRIPYRFCKGCAADYRDYILRLKGESEIVHPWQTDSWLESWTRWIGYQSVMDRYLKSKAFRQLLEAVKQDAPDK